MSALALDEPLSPELALVCPELRERALRLLPNPPAPATRRAATSRPAPPTAVEEPLAPLPVRIAVHAAARTATIAAEGALLAGAVGGLALGLTTLA